jgi:hypothetical protein
MSTGGPSNSSPSRTRAWAESQSGPPPFHWFPRDPRLPAVRHTALQKFCDCTKLGNRCKAAPQVLHGTVTRWSPRAVVARRWTSA